MNIGWKTVRLGEVVATVQREEKVDAAQEYRLLGVRLDGKGAFLREKIMGTQTAATKLFRVSKDDFIYSRLFACRGAFATITDELDNCYVSSEFPTFIPIQDRIDVNFLKYWFRLPTVIAAVDADCAGSTPLTRNRYKEKFFLALEIPLPTLAEQRRIVARIEELAAKINEICSIRAQEEHQIQQMLTSAFFSITKDTPRKPLSELASIIRRTVEISMDASYPELGIRSFGKGTFHKPAISGSDLGTKRIFEIKADDLLFSNVFAWEGAIAVAQKNDDGRFGSHRFISCVPHKDIAIASFLRFYFLTDEGMELIRAASPGSAGRNRTLGIDALQKTTVPVPPVEKQSWFANLLTEVDALERLQTETAAELDALLPAVLDRAFKGEL